MKKRLRRTPTRTTPHRNRNKTKEEWILDPLMLGIEVFYREEFDLLGVPTTYGHRPVCYLNYLCIGL